jgi:hypothetical protein
LFLRADTPTTAAISAAISRLLCAAVPKSPEALMSTTSMTVISRSSVKSFT